MKYKKLVGLTIIFIGIIIFTLPFTKNVYNDFRMKFVEKNWIDYTNSMSEESKKKLVEDADRYNATLPDNQGESFVDPFEQENLKIKSPLSGILEEQSIGIIKIPKLDLAMPIYMDATPRHLEIGGAVVNGTSFPTGGKGTRSVIAAHRGFYNFEHFLHIDSLGSGDRIYLDILGNLLIYEVYDKEVIMPYENDKIAKIENEDILTLLTCHPYPMSNKRLLVNCKRVNIDNNQNNNQSLTIDKVSNEKVYTVVNIQKKGFVIVSIIGIIFTCFIGFKIIKEIIRLKNNR